MKNIKRQLEPVPHTHVQLEDKFGRRAWKLIAP